MKPYEIKQKVMTYSKTTGTVPSDRPFSLIFFFFSFFFLGGGGGWAKKGFRIIFYPKKEKE